MKLIINVGNQDEAPEQLGFAHLVEHLGMRSTTHFPEGIGKFLQRKGLQGGMDFGASTGEVTVFELTIPSSNEDMLAAGMLVLHDWSGYFTFDSSDVEEERSAVLREAANANNPTMFALKNSIYEQLDCNELYRYRLLDEIQNIKTASVKSIRDFCKSWYHPMYQSIYIVGDVNEDEIEERIKVYLKDLNNEGHQSKKDFKAQYDIPLSNENKLLIEKSTSSNGIGVKILKRKKSDSNFGNVENCERYKASLTDEIINEMMRHRMQVISRKNKLRSALNLSVSRKVVHPFAGLDALVSWQTVESFSELKPSIISAAEEFKRLARFGFSEVELTRARNVLVSSIAVAQTKSTPSSALISKLVAHHFNVMPFSDDERNLKRLLLEMISLREINVIIKSWLSSFGNTYVVLSVPDTNDLGVPTESAVLSWMQAGAQKEVSKYVQPDSVLAKLPPLLTRPPSSEVSISEHPELGCTEVRLKNGATVLLRPLLSSKENLGTVNMFAFNKNEINLSDDEDLGQAGTQLSTFTGIDSMNPDDLDILKQQMGVAGSEFHIAPIIVLNKAMFRGRASQNYAEAMLHLLYLYMATPKLDSASFRRYWTSSDSSFPFSKKSGALRLQDSIYAVINNPKLKSESIYQKRFLPFDPKRFEQINAIYKRVFTNPAQFAFIITGDFHKKEMIHLVSKYIGAIPSSDTTHNLAKLITKSQQSSFRPGHKITLIGDSVNNADVWMLFSGTLVSNSKTRLTLEVLNNVIKQQLFKRLREQEKGVYNVESHILMGGTGQFYLNIYFETAPADIDRLTAAVRIELEAIAQGIIDESVFDSSKAFIRSQIMDRLNAVYYWENYLESQVRKNKMSADDLENPQFLDSFNVDDIRFAAGAFLDIEGHMLFLLL